MAADFKQDFPLLLQKEATGFPIAYLDNAATTQKPREVIDAVQTYYETYNANPHRGTYAISERATEAYEGVRGKVARFIGAADESEIVFTAGTTDALNQVALCYGTEQVGEGDDILLSVLEHHSNLLPWQRLARQKGANLRFVEPEPDGSLAPQKVALALTPRTKIVASTHVSNVLGSVNPIREIAALAHQAGAVVVVDAAQSVPHMPVDVSSLDADFLAFSGHKMYGPAGVGVLYGRKRLLSQMEPLRLGGGIVEDVGRYTSSLMEAPWKFEAGTQNTEGVIGLGAAIDYLQQIGMSEIQKMEAKQTAYALEKLSGLPEIELYGAQDAKHRAGILSFNVRDVHPHDTATVLAAHGVAVRAGHHCAQPLMAHMGVHATCRMSLCFYNTMEDIDRLASALQTVREVLGYGA